MKYVIYLSVFCYGLMACAADECNIGLHCSTLPTIIPIASTKLQKIDGKLRAAIKGLDLVAFQYELETAAYAKQLDALNEAYNQIYPAFQDSFGLKHMVEDATKQNPGITDAYRQRYLSILYKYIQQPEPIASASQQLHQTSAIDIMSDKTVIPLRAKQLQQLDIKLRTAVKNNDPKMLDRLLKEASDAQLTALNTEYEKLLFPGPSAGRDGFLILPVRIMEAKSLSLAARDNLTNKLAIRLSKVL